MAATARGRGQAGDDKFWRDAIRKAVLRVGEDGKTKRLDSLADTLVASGLKGEVAAMKEIGDRLDGKAMQPIAGADGGAIIVQIVKYAADDPKEA